MLVLLRLFLFAGATNSGRTDAEVREVEWRLGRDPDHEELGCGGIKTGGTVAK